MPTLDLDTWPRRAVYDLYRTFEDPWFSLTAEVDAGPTMAWCEAHGRRFSLACWWAVLCAAHAGEALRLRLRPDGTVWCHDRVRMGVTAARPDGAFVFAWLPDAEGFAAFHEGAEAEIAARVAAGTLDGSDGGDDVIYGTVVPWLRFTAIKHARQGGPDSGIPKIALGRASPESGRLMMPVSVEAHHALVDGSHVGAFFEVLQGVLGRPEGCFGR